MSTQYVDKYERYHNDPVTEKNPLPSNNAWLFTAYAKQLGLILPGTTIWPVFECYMECLESLSPLIINRHPKDIYPPMSRDEIIGLIALGFLNPEHIETNCWQFCNLPGFRAKPLYRVNWPKALAAMWRLRGKHRNAVWDEPDVWNIAFRLMPQDTWYAIMASNKKPSLLHTIFFYASSYFTIKSKDTSGKLILWLKLSSPGMRNSGLFKRIDYKKIFQERFPADHPFNTRAK